MKYVVVTGGVVSGLGKGITISSIGVLLKASGLRVTSLKIDPYLNTDAGTMSPFEHGEVFVLDDGGEVDLDLGNYERFLRLHLTRDHNLTTGKVYQHVIRRERQGEYLGKTVQVVPHVTDAIQDWIEKVARKSTDEFRGSPDVCLVEVGGTVGDIESMVFLEALRQFQFRVGKSNFCLVHVSLVPVLGAVGEQKTKPTQHGVKELRSVGLSPDIIVCRSDNPLEESTRKKIASFCHVDQKSVLAVHNLPNIYHVPLHLCQQGLAEILSLKLDMSPPHVPPMLDRWSALAEAYDKPLKETVKIALVGKYTGLTDSYLSVVKALTHAGIRNGRRVDIVWLEAENLEECEDRSNEAWAALKAVDGVLIPGGFGHRGFEGKIAAASYCRTSKIPFLGICLGMHAMVVEFARKVCGYANASSEEFRSDNPSAQPHVVVNMPEISTTELGGTMRLGSRATKFFSLPDGTSSTSQMLYGLVDGVKERHRHRYEINPTFVDEMESKGLFFTGRDADDNGKRMECAELPRAEHPFYWACQYHPEFQSYPHDASPPFAGLVRAAAGELELPFAKDEARGIELTNDAPNSPPSSPVKTSPFPSPMKETIDLMPKLGLSPAKKTNAQEEEQQQQQQQ